jgi:SAM-dependent methyltransferase
MNEYWDARYRAEGRIWGDSPSRTAEYALGLFKRNKVKTVLVPGSGYGRNSRLFSASGIDVTGVEISAAACAESRSFDPLTHVHNASVLDMSFLAGIFDAIYCFNVLHLFLEDNRRIFLREYAARVKEGGLMFFTVFSEKEPTFNKGREVEKDTFESKPGRPVHYFTAPDLHDHFQGMKIIESGIIEDPEDHGDGPHVHLLRYICVRR